MEKHAFLTLYEQDSYIKTVAKTIQSSVGSNFAFKGISGSMDMVLLATFINLRHSSHLIIAHDKEEAAYLASDLSSLLDRVTPHIFPSSYKRPYQHEEVDNANVLMRAEILNKVLSSDTKMEIIVSYPEALYEKVINKKSLQENTFTAKVGEKVDVEFITELLSTYDFEKTDFVYEPGQFAIRGGIIDVFSFANEYPYRIELFGKEIGRAHV